MVIIFTALIVILMITDQLDRSGVCKSHRDWAVKEIEIVCAPFF